jgi:tRNA-dihydrouridine synthase A
MLGREAYHNPWWLAPGTRRSSAPAPRDLTREEVEAAMAATWSASRRAHGTPWHSIARHMLGLYNGLPGARRWRQVWSDHRLKGQTRAR